LNFVIFCPMVSSLLFSFSQNRSLQFDTGSHSRLPASSNRFCPGSVLAYLREASPRACLDLLPALKNDSDRLVADQAQRILEELGQVS
jgi:hypothetical protein